MNDAGQAGRLEKGSANAEMAVVDQLCSFERRGPGTDAERRAANMLAERLRAMGRRAEIEPIHVHPQYALVHLIHVAVAIAGSLVAIAEPAVGFALVLLAATSTYLDLNTRLYLARSLPFRRASQNVVSPGSNRSAPLHLVLVAHYDAARSGYVFGERGIKLARRVPERWRLFLGPFRLVFWGGMVPLLPILGARMAGVDGTWLSLIQLVPTVLLIVAAFLLIDIALSEIVPGAYDNASGVATVLAAAARLQDEPPAGLDISVVLTGSEESLCEGMRAWVKRHGKQLDRKRTLVVNVDGSSYGTVRYEVSEGPVISYGLDRELIELCEALAAADEDDATRPKPVRSPLLTDALPARVRGLRTITITSLHDGLPPPWYHAPEDTPERANPASMERTTEFVVGLARLLDREAARVAARDDAGEASAATAGSAGNAIG